jgi:hypothetical protein
MLRTPEQVGENKSTGYGVGIPPTLIGTPSPLPYPPLYIGFLPCLIGGTMLRLKFFRKKSGKMEIYF